MEEEIRREEDEELFAAFWKLFQKDPDLFMVYFGEFLEGANQYSERSIDEFFNNFLDWCGREAETVEEYRVSVGMIHRFRLFSETDCLWQAICCNRRIVSQKQFRKLLARRRDIISFSENRPNRILAEKIKNLQKEWDQARITHWEERQSVMAEIKNGSAEISSVPVEIRIKPPKKRGVHQSTKEEIRSGIRNVIGKEFNFKLSLLSRTELSNLERALSLLGSGVAEKLLDTKKHLANQAPFMDAVNSGDATIGMSVLDGAGSQETIETASQIPDELKGFSFPSGTPVIIVGGSGVKKWNLLVKIIMQMGAEDCQFVFSENLGKISRISPEKLVIFLASINSHKAEFLLGRKRNLLRIYSSNISSFRENVARSYLAAKASGKIG